MILIEIQIIIYLKISNVTRHKCQVAFGIIILNIILINVPV